MALKIITVSMSASGTLVVDPDECNVDAELGVASRLVWVLDDRGTDARFVLPNDGKEKGFEWVGKVDSSIFGTAHLIGRGKIIIANDHHADGNTGHEQPYKLCVLDPTDGRTYKTSPVNNGVRTKDPVIINR